MRSLRRGVRLGVDVGAVRVGLARSDPDGTLATPVTTLARSEEGADVAEIVRLARELAVLEVVVGLPRSLSGGEGLAAGKARGYAEELCRALSGVPVRLVDERWSTVEAHRVLRDSSMPARRQRSSVDQAAAVLILQSALDAERTTGRPAGQTVGGRRPRTRRSGGRDEGARP